MSLIFFENLERAKGFEPSTPTLAKLPRCFSAFHQASLFLDKLLFYNLNIDFIYAILLGRYTPIFIIGGRPVVAQNRASEAGFDRENCSFDKARH
ncbi:hypothetical protein [Sphingobium sp. Sx8-8]|uniref:hypothetical protein n=1 Tax=Sphingobium sp. Sx8-8 TaxID=2933617 RepID=UPI001F56EF93|nr:hypothetical protein [Sphingobium sp. Sx8-8]